MSRRALLVRRGGLGDTLLLTPVLRALAARHPDLPIDVAGVLEFAALLVRPGLAARARSSEDLGIFRLVHDAEARAALAVRYPVIVADDPAFAGLAGDGCAVQVFDPRPQAGVRSPLAQQIAAQLGLVLRWPDEAWFVPERAAVSRSGPVVLAPGSGGRAKCWPRAHWLQLAAALAASAPIEVVVGPTEIERDDPRIWPWPVPVDFVVLAEPIGLAARLERAAAFVGNDSGPTHLAAMLAVPTVALFGGSDALVFAPQGPRVAILQAPGADLAALSPTVVHAAVTTIQGR